MIETMMLATVFAGYGFGFALLLSMAVVAIIIVGIYALIAQRTEPEEGDDDAESAKDAAK